MLNRNLYNVKAKYIQTNRFRSVKVWSRNELEIPKRLEKIGYTEIQSIINITPMPTERQLDYAIDLGCNLTPDMTGIDVSSLISQKVDNDIHKPEPGLMSFADNHDIVYSTYMGEKTLYNVIFNDLQELDKFAFFIFCVYRYLSSDMEANLDNSPHKNIFYNFANSCISNSKMKESLFENYEGRDLCFFGTSNNDVQYYGGSTRTTIFKAAKQYLIEVGLIQNVKSNNQKTHSTNQSINYEKGTEQISVQNHTNNKSNFRIALRIFGWGIMGLIAFIVIGLMTSKTIGFLLFIIVFIYGIYKEISNKPQN